MTIVLLALIAGAWAAHRTGRAHLAGSLLATASWIKLYPGLLVLYFFWKRDVRAASAALLSGIALGAVQLAAFGSSLFFGYFRDVLAPLAAYGQYPYYNLSVLGFFQRFVTTDPEVGQLRSLPLWVAVGRWMMIAGLLAATVALTGRARGDETASERLDLKFALVLTTALLVTPTLWLAGMAPLLICYVVVVRTLQARDRPRLIAATLIVSGLLVNFSLWPQYAEPRWSALTLSAGFFGALLLWAALAYSLVGMARVGDAKRLAS